jgi:hypothetical protein
MLTNGITRIQNNKDYTVLKISSFKSLVDVTLKESSIAISTRLSNSNSAISSLYNLKELINYKSETVFRYIAE